MGGSNILTTIEDGLRAEIPDLRFHVLSIDLPATVEFLVVSSYFQGMHRRKRTEFLTSKVEAIIGKQFYEGLYVASGVTEAEFETLSSDPNSQFGPAHHARQRPSAALPEQEG